MKNQSKNPLLIGIILDVSSSMKLNWKNKDGDDMPRIEVIRDAINKQARKLSLFYENGNKNADTNVFCIGMGFKKTDLLSNVDLSNGQEKIIEGNGETRTRVDIICDLITLSEIIPNKTALQQLKSDLNKKWNDYAKDTIKKGDIEDEIFEKLRYYIQNSLQQSGEEKLKKSWKNKLYIKLKGGRYTPNNRILQWLLDKSQRYVEYWEKKIIEGSRQESIRYHDSIMGKAREVFEEKEGDYVKYIEGKLQDFVDKQSANILTLMTIGYDTKAVLNYFNETKAEKLAHEIYEHLYQEVTNSILLAWTKSKAILIITEKDLKAKINYGDVRHLTERCIQKYGWGILNPLIEETVFDMFEKSFEKRAKEELSYWINFASKRETTRSIEQLVNILPESFEGSVYSDEFMFGTTPIIEAIHLATSRVLDKSHIDSEKVLIIISDGEFQSQSPDLFTDLLKDAGVTIISLYITSRNIITELIAKMPVNWPQGAQILFSAASEVKSDHPLVREISHKGYEIPDGVKLFYQINQSDVLGEILEGILSY